jgi:hypothetical protein
MSTTLYGTTLYSGYGYPAMSVYSGEIQIEANRWQMITIPVMFGYWDSTNHQLVHDGQTVANVKNYLLDQIADNMGSAAENYISIVNTFIGDNNYYWNYIPGVTNPLSSHNFSLAYLDGDRVEYVAFWLKSIHTENIIVKWGE